MILKCFKTNDKICIVLDTSFSGDWNKRLEKEKNENISIFASSGKY